MNRLILPATALSLMLAAAPLSSLAATKKPAHKPAAAKKAEPKAEVDDTPLNDAQMAVVPRVFTGKADCEFKQSVDIEAVDGKPGHFHVAFGKQRYDMVPEETTTGAVRLHDRKADVVWVQIPVKSMLLDNKAGHRLVDACQHPQQRAAVEAIEQTRVAGAAAANAASAASAAEAVAKTSGSGTSQAMVQQAAQAADKAAAAASAAARAASAAVSVSATPAAGGALGIGSTTPSGSQ